MLIPSILPCDCRPIYQQKALKISSSSEAKTSMTGVSIYFYAHLLGEWAWLICFSSNFSSGLSEETVCVLLFRWVAPGLVSFPFD
jgi:hypothetical protein